MLIIYYCYGSAHSSVIAAAIHLERLPRDRVPEDREILRQPRFDRTESWQIGTPFFMGLDRYNNRIYILGLGPERKINLEAIKSLLVMWRVPEGEVALVDTLCAVHPITRLGGFISRQLGLVSLGRPLVTLGIRLSYKALARIVAKTWETWEGWPGPEDNASLDGGG